MDEDYFSQLIQPPKAPEGLKRGTPIPTVPGPTSHQDAPTSIFQSIFMIVLLTLVLLISAANLRFTLETKSRRAKRLRQITAKYEKKVGEDSSDPSLGLDISSKAPPTPWAKDMEDPAETDLVSFRNLLTEFEDKLVENMVKPLSDDIKRIQDVQIALIRELEQLKEKNEDLGAKYSIMISSLDQVERVRENFVVQLNNVQENVHAMSEGFSKLPTKEFLDASLNAIGIVHFEFQNKVKLLTDQLASAQSTIEEFQRREGLIELGPTDSVALRQEVKRLQNDLLPDRVVAPFTREVQSRLADLTKGLNREIEDDGFGRLIQPLKTNIYAFPKDWWQPLAALTRRFEGLRTSVMGWVETNTTYQSITPQPGQRLKATHHNDFGIVPTTSAEFDGTIASVEVPGFEKDGAVVRRASVTVYRITREDAPPLTQNLKPNQAGSGFTPANAPEPEDNPARRSQI